MVVKKEQKVITVEHRFCDVCGKPAETQYCPNSCSICGKDVCRMCREWQTYDFDEYGYEHGCIYCKDCWKIGWEFREYMLYEAEYYSDEYFQAEQKWKEKVAGTLSDDDDIYVKIRRVVGDYPFEDTCEKLRRVLDKK